MTEKKDKRGGARPGAGRPRNDIIYRSYQVRMTPEEHKIFKELGGSGWLRAQIAKAVKCSAEPYGTETVAD